MDIGLITKVLSGLSFDNDKNKFLSSSLSALQITAADIPAILSKMTFDDDKVIACKILKKFFTDQLITLNTTKRLLDNFSYDEGKLEVCSILFSENCLTFLSQGTDAETKFINSDFLLAILASFTYDGGRVQLIQNIISILNSKNINFKIKASLIHGLSKSMTFSKNFTDLIPQLVPYLDQTEQITQADDPYLSTTVTETPTVISSSTTSFVTKLFASSQKVSATHIFGPSLNVCGIKIKCNTGININSDNCIGLSLIHI